MFVNITYVHGSACCPSIEQVVLMRSRDATQSAVTDKLLSSSLLTHVTDTVV